MIGRIRRFLTRHFGKIMMGALAVPVLIRLSGYAARKYLEYQNIQTRAMLRRYKKQQMFEMMDDNLSVTFRQWYEVMKENIAEHLNAVKYHELLKNHIGDRMENWEELKVIAFSRVLVAVYGSSILNVILRIQVNVVSGLLFKQMDEHPPGLEDQDMGGGGDATSGQPYRKITEQIQQDYMILTRRLCAEGVAKLCEMISRKVRVVLANLSLKQPITVSDLEHIFTTIRNFKFNSPSEPDNIPNARFKDAKEDEDWDPVTQAWLFMFDEDMKKKYLYFPETYAEPVDEHGAFLRTLIGEAFDLVNGEDAKTLLKFLEAQGTSHYLDILSNVITSAAAESSENAGNNNEAGKDAQSEHTLGAEPSIPLAKLITYMNKLLDVPFADDTWVALLLRNESLKTFSANIYESYSSPDFNYVA